MSEVFPIYMNHLHRSATYRMAEAHTHQAYELYYLLSGTQKFFIEHTVYSMEPHDVALISPGTLHRSSYWAPATHERIMVVFDPAMIETFTRNFPSIIRQGFPNGPVSSVTEPFREEVVDLFSRMFREYDRRDNFSPHLLENQLSELFLLLARSKGSDNQNQQLSRSYISAEDAAIGQAAYYITQNYQKPITLAMVAQEAALSPSYFSRRFKTITGLGFKEYLTSVRLQQAANLLVTTNRSITDIAFSCGFTGSNYFGDLFYRNTGLSPRSYRQHGAGKKFAIDFVPGTAIMKK